MTLLGQIDPLNYASLKPAFAAAQERAASRTQQQVAQVQLANAQSEQEQNSAFRAQMAIVAKAPSVEAYTQLLAVAPREYVEGLKASISQMDAAGKKTLAAQAMEPWLAGVNDRPDLMKERLKDQADGFEAKGMKEKAAGIRDLLARGEKDPNVITGTLTGMLIEAMGPERFNALKDAQGLTDERLKKRADRIAAQAKADSRMTDAALVEQIAKARDAELGADIKAIEKPLTAARINATIKAQHAAGYRDTQSGDRTKLAIERESLTFGDDVAKAAAEARTAQGLAAKTESETTPEALAIEREKDKRQVELYKQQTAQARTAARTLPPGIQDHVLKDLDASTEAMAAAVRARRVASEYRRISASASTGTRAKLEAWARNVAGTQNKRDALNQLADRVLVQEIVVGAQKLRPVSDNDIKMLERGMPDPRGNPKLVVDFMDALARAQEATSHMTQDRAVWQTQFQGVGNAHEDTTINGRPVKAGMSLVDFLGRGARWRELTAAIAAKKAAKK